MEENTYLYRSITNDLRAAISAGEYSPDEMIPSENRLASEYGTSRITVVLEPVGCDVRCECLCCIVGELETESVSITCTLDKAEEGGIIKLDLELLCDI